MSLRFYPTDDFRFDETQQRMLRDLAEFERMEEGLSPAGWRDWENPRISGPMSQSVERTRRGLRDFDPEVRLAAAGLVALHWDADEDHEKN